MTWNELKTAIEAMRPQERQQVVRFIEPYDRGRAGHHVVVCRAKEDLFVAGTDESEVRFVEKGDLFLQ